MVRLVTMAGRRRSGGCSPWSLPRRPRRPAHAGALEPTHACAVWMLIGVRAALVTFACAVDCALASISPRPARAATSAGTAAMLPARRQPAARPPHRDDPAVRPREAPDQRAAARRAGSHALVREPRIGQRRRSTRFGTATSATPSWAGSPRSGSGAGPRAAQRGSQPRRVARGGRGPHPASDLALTLAAVARRTGEETRRTTSGPPQWG